MDNVDVCRLDFLTPHKDAHSGRNRRNWSYYAPSGRRMGALHASLHRHVRTVDIATLAFPRTRSALRFSSTRLGRVAADVQACTTRIDTTNHYSTSTALESTQTLVMTFVNSVTVAGCITKHTHTQRCRKTDKQIPKRRFWTVEQTCRTVFSKHFLHA
jgi:hypothetical protein